MADPKECNREMQDSKSDQQEMYNEWDRCQSYLYEAERLDVVYGRGAKSGIDTGKSSGWRAIPNRQVGGGRQRRNTRQARSTVRTGSQAQQRKYFPQR